MEFPVRGCLPILLARPRMPAGRYEVRVHPLNVRGFQPRPVGVVAIPPASGEIPEFRMPAHARLVVRARANSTAGPSIRAFALQWCRPDGRQQRFTKTLDDGVITLTGLRPGPLEIIDPSGRGVFPPKQVLLQAGEVLLVELP